MRTLSVRTSFAVLFTVGTLVGTAAPSRACEAPAPVRTIDPPGYYDDPAGYARDVKPMRDFVAKLNAAADRGDWSCALTLLGNWAQSDALMGHLSGYQGYYERAWAGTDFAMVILRMPRGLRDANRGKFNAIDPWLERIAIATRNAEAINHLHNNLVYWAGLDLIAIGTITDNASLIDSGLLRVREGIRDIGPDGSLAREVKRGDRALHYHTFALLPLVFAAELVQRRNIDLYRENDGAIGRLANLVIDAVEDPASFRKITPIRQNLFSVDVPRRAELGRAVLRALSRSPPAGDHRAAPPVRRMAARRRRDGGVGRAAAVTRGAIRRATGPRITAGSSATPRRSTPPAPAPHP
ncbi:alginate lyase family protein [Burkholderia cenocepacia]|uniref:alginate lyase family protein n=1 Tax=Burkholderia cenocepacia TaxID=95486 RepID=UPI001FC80765|nr:alginate lyase family protein [Burkholderia cenocepacia]